MLLEMSEHFGFKRTGRVGVHAGRARMRTGRSNATGMPFRGAIEFRRLSRAGFELRRKSLWRKRPAVAQAPYDRCV
jgi:hypothetical protein